MCEMTGWWIDYLISEARVTKQIEAGRNSMEWRGKYWRNMKREIAKMWYRGSVFLSMMVDKCPSLLGCGMESVLMTFSESLSIQLGHWSWKNIIILNNGNKMKSWDAIKMFCSINTDVLEYSIFSRFPDVIHFQWQ